MKRKKKCSIFILVSSFSCRNYYDFFNMSTGKYFNLHISMLYLNFFNIVEGNTFMSRSARFSRPILLKLNFTFFFLKLVSVKNLGDISLVLSPFINLHFICVIQATLFSYNSITLPLMGGSSHVFIVCLTVYMILSYHHR